MPRLPEGHPRQEQSHHGQPRRGNAHSGYCRLQLLQQDVQSKKLSEEPPEEMWASQLTCCVVGLKIKRDSHWRPLLSDSMHLGFLIDTWLDFSLNLMTRENHFKLNSVNAYNCENFSQVWCPNVSPIYQGHPFQRRYVNSRS